MTDQLQAARDRIAEMCGWSITDITTQDGDPPRKIWRRGRLLRWEHPIPTSLDFVSRVWPEGWKWSYGSTPEHGWRWTAQNKYSHVTIEMDMSDRELVDRLSLLVLVLEWLQAHDRPAFVAACEKVRKAMEEY